MRGDFFKGVVQWEFDWRGSKGILPIFYHDNTSMSAIFMASTDKVKKYLPLPEMKLIEVFPGKCLVAFTAFEYRKTDINPYNEFSIAFLVTYKTPSIPVTTIAWQTLKKSFSAYIWQLPVTTEIARIGGVDIYGYPKFIADIVFQKNQDRLECNLSEKGKKILTLKGKVLPTAQSKVMRYLTYSVKNGIPLMANVFVNPLEFAQSNNPKAAEIDLGTDHPISEVLRNIGMSKSPLMYQYCPVNEAILFGGRNLMDI